MKIDMIEASLDIRKRIKDFNPALVFNYLKTLNQIDSIKAAALNNPVGWEEIWRQLKA